MFKTVNFKLWKCTFWVVISLLIICAIFSLQREMKEVTVSSDLCLRASNSLRDTSTTILKEYCLRNSYARSVHVRRHEGFNEANQRWVAPLRDRGNNMIICVSSNLCPRITTLYNYKWIWGHPIPVYLSMSNMWNSTGKAVTGRSSYPSQLMTPSVTCSELILCSILSMHVWVLSATCAEATTKCGIVLVWPCKTKAPACGAD